MVGGGLVGCTLALTLAEAGARPLLLERARLADGASGRNGGLLLPGTSELYGPLRRRWGAERAAALWRASTEGGRRLAARMAELEAAGWDCGWRPEGGLHAATSEAEAEELRRDAAALAEAGVDAPWLPREALARYSDLPLPPDVRGALLVPGGGGLHSGRLVTAHAAAAAEAGARIVEGVEVAEIAHADGGLRLSTSAGPLRAGHAIVATNAWAGRLLPDLAARVTPVRGQVLATAPLPPRRIRGAWSLNQGYEYLQQRPDGRIVLGGMRWTAPDGEVGRDRAEPEPAIQARLDAWLAESWPGLLAAASRGRTGAAPPVERRWGGIMAWTPDRMPLIGALPGRHGIFLACGFSGHGLPFAPLAAELLRRELGLGGPATGEAGAESDDEAHAARDLDVLRDCVAPGRLKRA